jgi:16S rRNA (guanine527-N7)-methyltransferase
MILSPKGNESAIQQLITLHNVSRETLEAFELYIKLILKWNKAINLIAKSTEQDIWQRHIADSAQLIKFIPKTATVLDIGSGAGFPGVIISLLQGNKVVLIEKNSKKCAFLHRIKATTNANIEIKNETITETTIKGIDIITCRALTSLANILELTERFKVKLVLLKGTGYKDEIIEAKAQNWQFNLKIEPSKTNKESAILIVDKIWGKLLQ